jgi:hypothetical protein
VLLIARVRLARTVTATVSITVNATMVLPVRVLTQRTANVIVVRATVTAGLTATARTNVNVTVGQIPSVNVIVLATGTVTARKWTTARTTAIVIPNVETIQEYVNVVEVTRVIVHVIAVNVLRSVHQSHVLVVTVLVHVLVRGSTLIYVLCQLC